MDYHFPSYDFCSHKRCCTPSHLTTRTDFPSATDPVVALPPRRLFPTPLYLLHPWSRASRQLLLRCSTFPHPCGSHAVVSHWERMARRAGLGRRIFNSLLLPGEGLGMREVLAPDGAPRERCLLASHSLRNFTISLKNSKRCFSNSTKWVASLMSTCFFTGALVRSRSNPSRSSG
jgi:hypothetical protein